MGVDHRTMARTAENYEHEGHRLGTHQGYRVADFGTGAQRRRKRLGEIADFPCEEAAQAALRLYVEKKKVLRKTQASYNTGELWEKWLEWREADKKPNTIHEFNWRALAPHFAHRVPENITEQDCRDYAKHRLLKLMRRPATVHTELSRLRSCIHWAAKRHFIDKDKEPIIWVNSPGGSKDLIIDVAEARELLAQAIECPHIYLFNVLCLTTAARHRAILELKWDRNIHFDTGLIDYKGEPIFDPMSKAYKKGRAIVPMNPLARAALEEAYKNRQTDYVIEFYGRAPLKRVKDGFKANVERAGINKPVTPHTLRHSVNTWLRERGVEVDNRAALLAHSDPRVTDAVYTHPRAQKILTEAVTIIDEELRA